MATKTHFIVSKLDKIEVLGQIVLSIEANRDAMKNQMVENLPVVNDEHEGGNGLLCTNKENLSNLN